MPIRIRHSIRTGIVTTQPKPPKNSINVISEEQENKSAESIFWKNQFFKKKQYSNVFQRLARSKNHKVVHPIHFTTNPNSGEGQKSANPYSSKSGSRKSETYERRSHSKTRQRHQ